MGKRFTDTEKFSDPWYRRLSSDDKVAWEYLYARCNAAGVIDLDEELANFSIGATIDWDSFVESSGKRVIRLESGKLFLTKFVNFQYGTISENTTSRPLMAVVQLLKKSGLLERVLEGYTKGIHTPKDKDKDKEQDKDKEKNRLKTKTDVGEWDFPDGWDCPELRSALEGWENMRKRIKKPVTSRASASKVFKRFTDPKHLAEVAELCEANEWQGLKPEYVKSTMSIGQQSMMEKL